MKGLRVKKAWMGWFGIFTLTFVLTAFLVVIWPEEAPPEVPYILGFIGFIAYAVTGHQQMDDEGWYDEWWDV